MPMLDPNILELERKLKELAIVSLKLATSVLAKPGALNNGKLTKAIDKAEIMIVEIKTLREELDKTP